MSVIKKLFKTGSLVNTIEVFGTMLDKLFTSKEEKIHAEALLEKLRQHPAELQVALNKLEAQHKSLLVAGWRPFIGWVCGFGIANAYIINPWLQWVYGIEGPQLPLDIMMELIIAMLGLSGFRTIEKIGRISK